MSNHSSHHDKFTSPYEAPSRMQKAVRWFRDKISQPHHENLKEMLTDALEDLTAPISADEKDLLQNMIHFGELTVKDIMMPRSDILAVESHMSWEELRRHVVEIAHTRLPVFEDSLDKIIGFIHVKDLFLQLGSNKPFSMEQVMRDILFVPPSMRIVDLLMKMRVSGCHMAIVVDEYGGTDGLVTMEDLIEELVGEIQDEHDAAVTAKLKWVNDHMLEADARVSIEELESALNEKIPLTADTGEFDTLGGFIFSTLGRVPARGEIIKIPPDLKMEILAADARRIRQIRISRAGDVPLKKAA